MDSAKIVFLVTGKNKAGVIKKILNEEEGYKDYPAAHVNPGSEQLYFNLDKGAAGNN